MNDFQTWVHAKQQRTEHALESTLPTPEIAPHILHEAMRYAVMGGGKRIRALLAYASAEFCGVPAEQADNAASAVELIHAYSLVHDDLPCMDDDDLRRGKPSCHKRFDEATALLVGDALQSLAFQIISQPIEGIEPDIQLKMVHLLATASGSRGMAGGQAIDLASIGKNLNQTELEHMHIHKTGALIRASALLGVYCSNQTNSQKIHAVDQFAQSIGLAFQVVDDILDNEADTKTLGKTAGKDAESNKPTYVTILGIVRAKELASELFNHAIEPLVQYGSESDRLIHLAKFITQRNF